MNLDLRDQLKQKKQAYVQDEILSSAASLFAEKGFRAITITDVAAQLGYTKSAVYYYFKNKEQLLYECLKLTYDCGQSARLEAEQMDGTAFEKLKHLYRCFMENRMEERGAYTTMANIRALPDDQQAELMERRKHLDRYSRMLIEKAIAEGALRPVDVRITSNFFLGAVNWILRWHTEDDAMSPRDVSNHFLDLFMNGIVART